MYFAIDYGDSMSSSVSVQLFCPLSGVEIQSSIKDFDMEHIIRKRASLLSCVQQLKLAKCGLDYFHNCVSGFGKVYKRLFTCFT